MVASEEVGIDFSVQWLSYPRGVGVIPQSQRSLVTEINLSQMSLQHHILSPKGTMAFDKSDVPVRY